MTVEPVYIYKAKVSNIVDGDTIDVELDLGFRITTRQRVRLYGVNTPERSQPGYQEAKDLLRAEILFKDVSLQSYKPEDKYGRWLAAVYVGPTSISQLLIDKGLGVPYFGGSRG